MKKTVLRVIMIFAAILVVTGCTESYAYFGDTEEVPISIGGGPVVLDGDVHQCYFTADEDHGYTLTVRMKDYISLYPTFYKYRNGNYDKMYDDQLIYSPVYGYTGDYVEKSWSVYCHAGERYACYFEAIYPDEEAQTPIEVTLTKTNKAGIYNGMEYWSEDREGEEVLIIMDYTGSDSTVTVPGHIEGLRVDTISNAWLCGNNTVEVLRFEEGVRCLRNGVACDCDKLRRVEFPSTMDEIARKPFNGCHLDEIVFPQGTDVYSWKDHCLYTYKTLTAYYGPETEFHVAEGTDKLYFCAFEKTDVRVLYLPESVKNMYHSGKYFDEIHVASSFCDIDEDQWIDTDDNNRPLIGKVFGRHNGYTEYQAAKYGVPFEAEGEDVQQYYEVPTHDEAFIEDADIVYRYGADDCFYAKFYAPETGRYIVGAGMTDGVPQIEYVRDSKGTDMELSDKYIDAPYGRKSVLLQGKEHYTIKVTDIGEEYGFPAGHIANDCGIMIQTPTGLKAYCDYYSIEFDEYQGGDQSDGTGDNPGGGDPGGNTDGDGQNDGSGIDPQDGSGEGQNADPVEKLANTLSVRGKTPTVRFSKLKKKTQYLPVSKTIRFVNKGQGTKKYSLYSAKKGKKSFKKKFKINAATGKLTVKKGLKKGTYTLKVRVRANGDDDYKPSALKTVTIKVKVK